MRKKDFASMKNKVVELWEKVWMRASYSRSQIHGNKIIKRDELGRKESTAWFGLGLATKVSEMFYEVSGCMVPILRGNTAGNEKEARNLESGYGVSEVLTWTWTRIPGTTSSPGKRSQNHDPSRNGRLVPNDILPLFSMKLPLGVDYIICRA